jgi:hypothetical protein
MLAINRKLALAGALLAMEGPNEPNNWGVTWNGVKSNSTDAGPIADWQAAYYARSRADEVLSKVPMFHSSESGGSEVNNVGLQFLTIPKGPPPGVLRPARTKCVQCALFVSRHVVVHGRDREILPLAYFLQAGSPYDACCKKCGLEYFLS